MKKIMVTAVGGDIGYGIVKALKSGDKDLYIIGCDIKKYNVSYDLVDEFITCPPYSDEKLWMEFIASYSKENSIDIIWPVTESEIRILKDHPDLTENITVIMNSDKVLDISLDKEKTSRFLKESGITTPKIWESVNDSDITFPVIVKERVSCGSHAVKIACDTGELKDIYKSMKDPLIQEYISGEDEEYTLTVFSDGKTVNHIAFKRELGFGGMSRFVELVKGDHFENIAQKLASAFELKGSINIQMRKRGEDCFIFEINPRISSTLGFRVKLGFDDVSWWLDMIEGKKIPQYIAPDKKVFGVRSVEEKLFFEE